MPSAAPAFSAARSGPEPEEILAGTTLLPLHTACDARGRVAEIYRPGWVDGAPPLQWTMLTSEAGVVRGVHLHLRHSDYVVILSGRCWVGLHDLRPRSATATRSRGIELCGATPTTLTIPPGVAHGFYFPEPTVMVLGLSRLYDPDDELGCYWLDPDLRIDWPVAEARLSARDAALPSLRGLLQSLAWMPD